jgi:hypothetical protein
LKNLLILFIFLLCYTVATAQGKLQARVGTSFNTGMKVMPGNNLSWFPVFEFGFYVRVDPVEENGLGFIGRLNVLGDPIRYSIGSDKWFTIRQANVAFDGLIRFPTKYENLNILVGIGLEYAPEPKLGYGVKDGSDKGVLIIDLDSSLAIINEYRRILLPSVSTGILYQPLHDKKFSVCLLFKQQLLRLFTEDIVIPYKENGSGDVARINYMPSYLKLGVNYDLW